MNILVRSSSGSSVVRMQVEGTETMSSLSERIWNDHRIPVERQQWQVSIGESSNVAAIEVMEPAEEDLKPNIEDLNPNAEKMKQNEDDMNEKDEDESSSEMATSDDSEYEEENEKRIDRKWTLEEKKRVVDYYNATPGRTFKTVKRKWTSLTQSQFSRFVKQVANGGTKWEKIQQVNASVLSRFNEARSAKIPVHDKDLAKWAMEKVKQIGLQQFTASSNWIRNFKQRHGVVARKVTSSLMANPKDRIQLVFKTEESTE